MPDPGRELNAKVVFGVAGAALLLLFFVSQRDTLFGPHHLSGSTMQQVQLSRNAAASSSSPQLLLVQATFRHGARTPLGEVYWPETEYGDCSMDFPGARLDLTDESGKGGNMSIIDLDMKRLPGGCRMGQLTSQGYGMAQDLGAWLRNRYTKELPIISEEFQADQVWARSTRYQRTYQTLQGVVTGLWPELGQPGAPHVTVAASDVTREYAYGHNETCPALTPLLSTLLADVEARDASDPAAAAAAVEVSTAMHLPGSAADVRWVRLHDSLAAMAAHQGEGGTRMPEGWTPDVMDIITRQATRYEADVIAPTPQVGFLPAEACSKTLRLSIGPLLWHIQDNMMTAAAQHGLAVGADSLTVNEQQQGQQQQAQRERVLDNRKMLTGRAAAAEIKSREGAGGAKLFLYSGHDSTITPMLAALGVPEQTWPPFTANIVWELWHMPDDELRLQKALTPEEAQSNSLWVRLLYNRKPLDLGKVLHDTSGGPERSPSAGWARLPELQTLLEAATATEAQHHHECHMTVD